MQAAMGQAPKEIQDIYNQYGEGVTRYTPYLSKQDFQSDPNLEYVGITDPESAKELVDLKNTDPKQYASRMASFLSDMAFSGWAQNRNVDDVLNRLETYKDTNPDAYYSAYLSLKGKEMGWNAGNNAADRNAPMQQEIKSVAKDAIQSGLNPNQINSIVSKNFGDYSNVAARTNAVNAASGGGGFNFGTDMLPGLMLVGSALLGAGAADYLATGAEAANAASTTGEALGSTGFTPVDGASFSIDPNATYSAGTNTAFNAANISSNPVTQSMVDFANASPDPIQAMSEMQNMTPNELANALGPGAGSASTPIADTYNSANRLKNLAQALQSGSKAVGAASGTSGTTSGAQQLAQTTTIPQQQFGGLYEMNKNPFTFQNPLANALAANKPTTGLDVSGTSGQALNTQNQTANLLRMFG